MCALVHLIVAQKTRIAAKRQERLEDGMIIIDNY